MGKSVDRGVDKMTRLSRKLRKAVQILEGERYGDFDEGLLLARVQRGRVSPEQIYKAVEHFGYRWKNGGWELTFPRWLETLIRKEEEKYLKDYDRVTAAKLRVVSSMSRKYAA